MIYIEAPNPDVDSMFVSVFLAGGITNCSDWQKDTIQELKNLRVKIYNPRRVEFNLNREEDSKPQVRWEYENLRKADIVIFRFCEETMCPIVLWELAAALERNIHKLHYQKILIYCEPKYVRSFDVTFQTELANESYQKATASNELAGIIFQDYDKLLEHVKQEIAEFPSIS